MAKGSDVALCCIHKTPARKLGAQIPTCRPGGHAAAVASIGSAGWQTQPTQAKRVIIGLRGRLWSCRRAAVQGV